MTRTTNSVPEPVGADMLGLLKTLKLGALADTLPQRAALARQHKTSHLTFLQQLLADEVSRRESSSAARRSAKAGLDPSMRIDNWRAADDLLYDRPLLEDLTTLRFIDAGHSAILLGPVGVGKTHLANALGHMAIGRRKTVLFARADKLFHRLKAARLDNSVDAELRRITAVDILIIDDFALRALDATETNDFYELIVERHQQTKTTIVTSNREPAEWLTMTADALLAQSAIDRLTSRAHTLVIEGPSYANDTDPDLTDPTPQSILNNAPRWSHPRGNPGGPIAVANDSLEIFDQTGSRTLLAQLKESASPLDASIQVFLKSWAVRALGVEVSVDDALEPPTVSNDVSLALAPALVLRKRGAFALVEYYDQMINQAEQVSAKTPLGLAQLVTSIEAEERLQWLESTGATAPSELAEDPLFPLPANAEQSKIIERLGGDSGVVVEGPPGTGKTHTIANLMSALLARGQRVLVTSEKSQALQVLRDKLPEDMQELCVSITDLSRGGSQELNRSVATIAERKTSFIPEASERTIADLTDKREQALTRRSTILESIRALRESETYQHPEIAPGYSGTLAAIVRRLEKHRDRLEWLPGPLASAEPALSAAEFRELVRLVQLQTTEHEARAGQTLPRLEGLLPGAAHMTSLFDAVNRPPMDLPAQTRDLVEIIESVDDATAQQVLAQCETLREWVDNGRALAPDQQHLANSVLTGAIDHLWSRVQDLDAYVEEAIRCDRLVGTTTVEAPAVSRGALRTVEAWLNRLQSGVEWKGRFRRSAEQKAFDELELNIAVDGDPVRRADELEIIVAHLKALDAVESARQLLATLGINLPGEQPRAVQVNSLYNVRRDLTTIERLVAACNDLKDTLYRSARRQVIVRSVDEAESLSHAASAITLELQRRSARAELARVTDSLSNAFGPAPAPEARTIIDSVHAASRERLSDAVSAYARAQQQQREYEECQVIKQRLRAEAPALLDELVARADEPDIAVRLETIHEAWHWRRAHDWVEKQRAPGLEARLSSELDATTADISSLTSRLAAERAWMSCLQRMSASEVTALQSYRDHIRSVGKGTGKDAERFRQAARMAMREAQSAVLTRLSEFP